MKKILSLIVFIMLASNVFAEKPTKIIVSSRTGLVTVWLDGEMIGDLFYENTKAEKKIKAGEYKIVVTDHFDEEEILFEKRVKIYSGNTVKVLANTNKTEILGIEPPVEEKVTEKIVNNTNESDTESSNFNFKMNIDMGEDSMDFEFEAEEF